MSMLLARKKALLRAAAAPGGLWYGLVDYGSTNNSRHYTIPHVDMLDIPDGQGFAWGFFARVTVNTGSNVQYVLSSGTTPEVPRFTIDLHEASDTQTPNQYQAITVDAAGDAADMATTSTPDADGVLRLIVFQYNGTSTWQLKFCTPGGTPTLEASDTEAAWDGMVAPTDWYLGARSDLETARYWQNELGGLFRANRFLTDTEIQNIAAGTSPVTVLGAACIEAWPFKNGAVESEHGFLQGVTTAATRQGTGWDSGGGSANITIGTFGNLTDYYGGSAKESHVFTDNPVVDGGGAKLVIAVVRVTGFGQRNNNPAFDPEVLTLNGVSYSTLLTQYMVNIGGTYYVQAYVAIWDSPTAGPIVVQSHVNQDFSALGVYYWNLTGLHTSPLGAISRNNIASGTTALPWSITTTAANSLVLYINGVRNNTAGTQDFTPTDGSMTLLAKQGGSTVDGRGAFRAGHRNGLAIGTYQGGGTWSQSEPHQIGGMGIELRAA